MASNKSLTISKARTMAIVAAGWLAANEVCQGSVVVNAAAVDQGQTAHSHVTVNSKDVADNMQVQV